MEHCIWLQQYGRNCLKYLQIAKHLVYQQRSQILYFRAIIPLVSNNMIQIFTQYFVYIPN